MLFYYNVDEKEKKLTPSKGYYLCGICMFSLCLYLFFVGGTPFTTHILKICILGSLACLNCPNMSVCVVCVYVSGPDMEGCLVQDWSPSCALSCLPG